MFVQLTKDLLGRKVGERLDVADTDGQQLIRAGAATAVSDDPVAPVLQRALDGAFARYSQGLDAALNQALRPPDQHHKQNEKRDRARKQRGDVGGRQLRDEA